MHLGLEALIAFVETLQVRQPLHFSVRDLIERVLHPGGEGGVDEIGEMLLQKRRHRKGREAGSE